MSTPRQEDFGTKEDPTLYVADMVTYRTFSWGSMGPYLHGLTCTERWATDQTATCLRWPRYVGHGDAVPDPGCTCGIYSFYDSDREWGAQWGSSDASVFAAIRVSGTCITGSLGVRSEKATILALQPRYSFITAGLPEALAAYYPTVPVFTDQHKLLEAFPPSDWESVVGPLPVKQPEPEFDAGIRWSATSAHTTTSAWQQSRSAYLQNYGLQTYIYHGAVETDPEPKEKTPAEALLEKKRNANRGPSKPKFTKQGRS